MSDRVKLAREIAARTELRFLEIKPEPRRIRRQFIETSPSRGGTRVPFTEEELTAMRNGLTVKEYRLTFVRNWLERYANLPRPGSQTCRLIGP